MSVETFGPSPTWSRMSAEVGRDLQRGVPWRDIHQLHIAVNMDGMKAYEYYAERLRQEFAGFYDSEPVIIEIGPGYGAMSGFWPAGSTVYNVDLPEMLELQQRYLQDLARERDLRPRITHMVPIAELAGVPFQDAYLFSVWALTETTRKIWQHCIDQAEQLRGAFVIGYEQWADEPEPWPWQQLADEFDEASVVPEIHFPPCDALELVGRNRVR